MKLPFKAMQDKLLMVLADTPDLYRPCTTGSYAVMTQLYWGKLF